MKKTMFPAVFLVALAGVGCDKGSADTANPTEAAEATAEPAAPEAMPEPAAEEPGDAPMDEEPADDEDGGGEDDEE